MATDIRTLDPDAPDYDERVEAALLEEDAADGRADAGGGDEAQLEHEAAGGTEQTGQEPAAQEPTQQAEQLEAAAGEGDPEGAAAGDKPAAAKGAPAAGVLGKDGATVLPYVVLKNARDEARANRIARQEAERRAQEAEAELQRLRAAGAKAPEDVRQRAEEGLLSDEERADFPALAKMERAILETRGTKPAKTPTGQAPAAGGQEPAAEGDAPQGHSTDDGGQDPEVQEAIDSVPDLASWQASDPDRWRRAVKHDEVLRESPKWKGKPMVERLKRVAELVADEFEDVPAPAAAPAASSPQPPKQPQPKQDPRLAAQKAARTAPSTLSDFKTGGTADGPGNPVDRLKGAAQVAKFADMSDEEIDRHLAKLG